MSGRVRISDDQRRARLAVRHGLAPGHHLPTVADAAAAVGALHATEPASVHLAALARTGADLGTIDAALYDERSVVKQLAMRRTVFAFPRALLPAVWGSAAARVASQQRRQLARQVVEAGIATDGAVWVRETTEAVLAALREHGPMTTAQLREMLPALDSRLTYAEGKSYAATTPIAPRVLTTLAASGAVLRGANEGGWKLSRPRWTLAGDWLGEQPEPLDERAGYAVLVEAWLRSFGPGTEADLEWWLGATRSAVRRALADVGAVEVDLDGGAVGVVLPDDVDPVGPPGRWAALLPALDPTTMGWKQRDFYLGPHAALLFDRNGNGGPTAWVDGRIVGGWTQKDDGQVVVVACAEVDRAGQRLLDDQADRLTSWLSGDVVRSIYQSPLVRSGSSSST
ncbi:MAG TPA: winged helix DNA-binding domain-containing protein [Marmoricola sp.]|nr:winged helix DNA-binding domain-containing protein [Marmoricola sp.]